MGSEIEGIYYVPAYIELGVPPSKEVFKQILFSFIPGGTVKQQLFYSPSK